MSENTSSYAVVKTSGAQIKVSAGQKIVVNRIEGEVGASVTLSDVLAVSSGDGATVTLGTPLVANAKVTAKILEHLRGPKVMIFKKRRRKGYTKQQGHRQDLTKLLVESIAV